MILYNRYIPKGNTYERVIVEDSPSPPFSTSSFSSSPSSHQTATSATNAKNGACSSTSHASGERSLLKGLSSLFGTGDHQGNILSSLLKQWNLNSLDTGDILLVLILLFLFLEGDNLEIVITLGLLLLMGL